jgi:hypothetical protein
MELRSLWLAALLVAGLAVHAVGVAAEASGGRTPSAPGATVEFANLADGEVVPPGFTVRFSISGMGIAPAGAAIENTGHFHLLIDLPELPDLGQPLPATEHIRHYGKGQTSTELDLPEGQHTLQLLLADHLHVAHDPPVMSEIITITVSGAATLPTDS